MKTKSTKLIGALFAFAMIASACGGSDEASGADQEVIDAVVAQMQGEADLPAGVDVNCMGREMVAGLGGAETMASEYGLTAEAIRDGKSPDDIELSRDAAISLAGKVLDCGLDSVIIGEMTGDGMSSDDASCILKEIDQDAIRDMFAAEFMNEADATAVGEAAEEAMFGSMFGALDACDIDPTALAG